LQENTAHPREILQMKINDTAEKSNRFNAKGIVHGRLSKVMKRTEGALRRRAGILGVGLGHKR